MIDLSWLNNVLEVIPDKPKYQKNIFDIAGFPRWETVNSNILAFYFDKEEEHNFSTLFIESLLGLLPIENGDRDRIDIESEFEVLREVYTQNGKYIDIVIKSKADEINNSSEEKEEEQDEELQKSDWAIIIENKIDSPLYNDLAEYWDSIKATNKVGFVLSKDTFDLTKYDNQCYYSINHGQLIQEVSKNLFKHFSKVNDKHLILLKEYFNNIKNLYLNNIMDKELSRILNQFHVYSNDIDKLFKTQTRLLEFISEETFAIFKLYGFKPYSEKKTSNSKHFYEKKENERIYDGFRFWVDLGHTLYHNCFLAVFELHGKDNTRYGSKVKDMLYSQEVFTSMVTQGSGGNDNGGYNHIYRIEIPLGLTEHEDFAKLLKSNLESHFFKHENNFLDKAVEALQKAKIEEYEKV